MLRITVCAETSASPERVVALAGTDFSVHRAQVWPNVTRRRLEVHDRGDTYADVTEGATGIAWFAWEHSRYDWSQPDLVKQTVLDSNVLEPGSTWELRVAPQARGSTVEMTLERRFRSGFAGRIAYVLNHVAGERGFAWMLRRALAAVEQASAPPARADAANATT